jgi:hypothetical protein
MGRIDETEKKTGSQHKQWNQAQSKHPVFTELE